MNIKKTLFENIIERKIPASIVYEDEKIIAFKDINPISEGHVLVVPKKFSRNLLTIKDDILAYLMVKSVEIAKIIIKQKGVDGFRLHVNNEKSSEQVVFHTHVHIIPSRKGDPKWKHIPRGQKVY
ncbi:MAG: HIT family protein [Mollicutes bacterium PWAP]|nr:HIT family protein [Mollicutes bacterium PWAP]